MKLHFLLIREFVLWRLSSAISSNEDTKLYHLSNVLLVHSVCHMWYRTIRKSVIQHHSGVITCKMKRYLEGKLVALVLLFHEIMFTIVPYPFLIWYYCPSDYHHRKVTQNYRINKIKVWSWLGLQACYTLVAGYCSSLPRFPLDYHFWDHGD